MYTRAIFLTSFFIIIFLLDLKSQKADTLNITDSKGKKQGWWLTTGKDKPGDCYKADQKIQVGLYKDDRKTGTWREFFCNGNTKKIMTYKRGQLEGTMKVFNEDGQLKEESVWKNNQRVKSVYYYKNDKSKVGK